MVKIVVTVTQDVTWQDVMGEDGHPANLAARKGEIGEVVRLHRYARPVHLPTGVEWRIDDLSYVDVYFARAGGEDARVIFMPVKYLRFSLEQS